ncbi:hypothetical protein M9H77_22411 [Catharanthus roseus]|uniref:Uncharacterized protein n=1 Tax=Catharanthus roseus TaxID=4058 RepID=A0ACC0AQ44_CATRO|nr:hypothetical protein M9H77_22411 [Catharanthus roseus]
MKRYVGLRKLTSVGIGEKFGPSKRAKRASYCLWFAKHGALLTKSLLVKRRVVEDGICPACHQEEETLLHALRDCQRAKMVWEHFAPQHCLQQFYSLDEYKAWHHWLST